eukprot:1708943-Prymnesium_polylepis.3
MEVHARTVVKTAARVQLRARRCGCRRAHREDSGVVDEGAPQVVRAAVARHVRGRSVRTVGGRHQRTHRRRVRVVRLPVAVLRPEELQSHVAPRELDVQARCRPDRRAAATGR